MPELPIYLDHHATTPCDPRVVDKMLPFFTQLFGNPASVTHVHGRVASTALEESRAAIADSLGVRPTEIYFTAGATESNNLAISGVRLAPGDHVITSAIEHKSVLEPFARLTRSGVEVEFIKPDREGFINADKLGSSMRPNTRFVSIMAANGEIGTIQPLSELASICKERNVLFHTDATQAVGKLPVDLSQIRCDLLSLSGHKIYGPKGIGALFIRRGVRLDPLLIGGGQEKGVRSGTVNVPGAVGLGEALQIRTREMAQEATVLTEFRNRLWDSLVTDITGTVVHGPREQRLPGNLNVSFHGLDAESLMIAMRRFSLSSGSACASGEQEPSHVLKAIGLDDATAMGSIRIGLGRTNTAEHINLLIGELKSAVSRLREISVV
jgi:cysteine desulfurase